MVGKYSHRVLIGKRSSGKKKKKKCSINQNCRFELKMNEGGAELRSLYGSSGSRLHRTRCPDNSQ